MGPFDDLTPAQREQIREAHASGKESDADRRWREGVEIQDRMHRVEERLAHADTFPGTNEPKWACPVCERTDITITKKGRVRVHGTKQGWTPSNCNGSGQKPKEG